VTIDIAAKAKALVDTVLAEPANDHDIDLVQRQLGRYPRGMVAVGARCVCGRPLAVITRPVLPGGIPFPTTCYLTGSRQGRLPCRGRRRDAAIQRHVGLGRGAQGRI